jgi:hypothetical protein
MLFELLGFLLSTNAKVKKMTTVSAVMFEIVEMYIILSKYPGNGGKAEKTKNW